MIDRKQHNIGYQFTAKLLGNKFIFYLETLPELVSKRAATIVERPARMHVRHEEVCVHV